MTWFKADDGFYDHPKVEGLSMAARGLWLTAGTWCAKHLTDGVISAARVRTLGGTPTQVRALIAHGLWVDCGPNVHPKSYAFHDWNDMQPARNEVLDSREREREKKREWRKRKGHEQGKRENVPGGQDRGQDGGLPGVVPAPRPDPSRPDPSRPLKEEGVTGGGVVTASRAGAQDPPSEIPPEWVVDPRRARCAVHAGMDRPPACGACADARRAAEGERARKADSERDAARERRETRDACDLCDPNGLVRVGGKLTRCPHDPDRLASMQAAAEEPPAAEDPPVGTPGYETPAALTDWRRKWRNRTQLLDGETRLPAIEHDPNEIFVEPPS